MAKRKQMTAEEKNKPPKGSIPKDFVRLKIPEHHWWRNRPYYADYEIKCADCKRKWIVSAREQQWFYEEVGGSIYSTVTRCLDCRRAVRTEKAEQRLQMDAAAQREPHPNEAFFKKAPRRSKQEKEMQREPDWSDYIATLKDEFEH